MGQLARIFTRSTIINQVEETHKNIIERLDEHEEHLNNISQADKFDILYASCFPDEISTKNCGLIYDQMNHAIKTKSVPVYNQTGKLQLPKIGVIKSVVTKAQTDKRLAKIINTPISRFKLDELEAASQCFSSNRPIYGLKLAYLHRRHHNESYPEYQGILPSTTPVRKALKAFYGITRKDPYFLTKVQWELAEETKLSPMYINTALWVYGQNIL